MLVIFGGLLHYM